MEDIPKISLALLAMLIIARNGSIFYDDNVVVINHIRYEEIKWGGFGGGRNTCTG